MTYNDFTKQFMALYFDLEKKAKAKWALQVLWPTSLVADYTHKFVNLALDSGLEVLTLIILYTQDPKKDIQLVLILGRIDFCTVAKVSNLALRIDAEINGHETAPQQPTKARQDPETMEISTFFSRCGKKNRLSR
ncbi:uncharacterized protein VP01_3011g3 [Puccinia sorghi]|uniref:Uncharacterized protein n=1 Tax=Puccinia sorghi TaxID=27349 RepID=A0A0L6V0C3_9BASI|nr:uncharacterized protein VP01_3011g3 [Puccinia sorghi]